MFSSKEQLQRKTGSSGVGRFSYLQSLVTEYQYTSSEDQKHQILANLANFAYDPINYDYFRRLNILDLFLDGIEETDDALVEYAIGGISNCCLDKKNKEHILQNDGVKLVVKCLSSPNENTVLSAITTLMFLTTPESKPEITSLPVVECILRFSQSVNVRLRNLATVFLEDYCSKEQVEEARAYRRSIEGQHAAGAATAQQAGRVPTPSQTPPAQT